FDNSSLDKPGRGRELVGVVRSSVRSPTAARSLAFLLPLIASRPSHPCSSRGLCLRPSQARSLLMRVLLLNYEYSSNGGGVGVASAEADSVPA
ncbi:MAG: hypothetical protein ABIY46_02200, partial [Gemmatimonadales bacterium]